MKNIMKSENYYAQGSAVIRESIIALSFRLFVAEFVIGLIGMVVRTPLILLASNLSNYVPILFIYSLSYFVFQLFNISILIGIILFWYNKTYLIREKDFIVRSGVFDVTELLIQYDNVEKITVRQSLIGRIFNYGTLEIFNPLLKTTTYFINIPSPKKYAEAIQHIVPKVSDDNRRLVLK